MGLVSQQEGGNGVPERVSFVSFLVVFLGPFGHPKSYQVVQGVYKYVQYMVEYNVCLLCWAGTS